MKFRAGRIFCFGLPAENGPVRDAYLGPARAGPGIPVRPESRSRADFSQSSHANQAAGDDDDTLLILLATQHEEEAKW